MAQVLTTSCTGFEFGALYAGAFSDFTFKLFTAAEGDAAVQSGVKRSGDHALRVQPTSSQRAWAELGGDNSIDSVIARTYARFASLPDADGVVWSFRSAGTADHLGLEFDSASGKLRAFRLRDGMWERADPSGPVLAEETWHRLELYLRVQNVLEPPPDYEAELRFQVDGSAGDALALGPEAWEDFRWADFACFGNAVGGLYAADVAYDDFVAVTAYEGE